MDFEHWRARLLLSNLTDERPVFSIDDDGGPVRIWTGRPRTLALRVTYDF
jgi:outer membrane receptor protein involved in Fe transport